MSTFIDSLAALTAASAASTTEERTADFGAKRSASDERQKEVAEYKQDSKVSYRYGLQTVP